MKKIYTLDCGYLYDWAGEYIKAYTSLENVINAYLKLLDEYDRRNNWAEFDKTETPEEIKNNIKEIFDAQPIFEGACECIITEWEIAE
jgi:hypothetical protein